MRTYVLQRLILAGFLALGAGTVVFFLIQLAPGDVVLAALGDAGGLTPEQVAVKRQELGLDRPLPVQYVEWLGRVVRGDLGVSFVNGRPIARDLSLNFPRTLELDRARYPQTAAIRAHFAAAGFSTCETHVAEHLQGALSASKALAENAITPSATSQLAIISEAELQAGIARIRTDLAAAQARGEDLPLHYDLHLYASLGTT